MTIIDLLKVDDSKKNPCWEGYEMVGTKMKDGRRVPNCVKKKIAKGDAPVPGDAVSVSPTANANGLTTGVADAGRLLSLGATAHGASEATYHSARSGSPATAPASALSRLEEAPEADEGGHPDLRIVPLAIGDTAHKGRSIIFHQGQAAGTIDPSKVAGQKIFTVSSPAMGGDRHFTDRDAAIQAIHDHFVQPEAEQPDVDPDAPVLEKETEKAMTIADLAKAETAHDPKNGQFTSGSGKTYTHSKAGANLSIVRDDKKRVVGRVGHPGAGSSTAHRVYVPKAGSSTAFSHAGEAKDFEAALGMVAAHHEGKNPPKTTRSSGNMMSDREIDREMNAAKKPNENWSKSMTLFDISKAEDASGHNHGSDGKFTSSSGAEYTIKKHPSTMGMPKHELIDSEGNHAGHVVRNFINNAAAVKHEMFNARGTKIGTQKVVAQPNADIEMPGRGKAASEAALQAAYEGVAAKHESSPKKTAKFMTIADLAKGDYKPKHDSKTGQFTSGGGSSYTTHARDDSGSHDVKDSSGKTIGAVHPTVGGKSTKFFGVHTASKKAFPQNLTTTQPTVEHAARRIAAAHEAEHGVPKKPSPLAGKSTKDQVETGWEMEHGHEEHDEPDDQPKVRPTEKNVNHRDNGAKGYMSPEFATHMKPGNEVDLYDHDTGDKIYAKVTSKTRTHVNVLAEKNGKFKERKTFKIGFAPDVETRKSTTIGDLAKTSVKVGTIVDLLKGDQMRDKDGKFSTSQGRSGNLLVRHSKDGLVGHVKSWKSSVGTVHHQANYTFGGKHSNVGTAESHEAKSDTTRERLATNIMANHKRLKSKTAATEKATIIGDLAKAADVVEAVPSSMARGPFMGSYEDTLKRIRTPVTLASGCDNKPEYDDAGNRIYEDHHSGEGPRTYPHYLDVVATFPDHAYVRCSDEDKVWKVPYEWDGEEVSTGEPELVVAQFVPIDEASGEVTEGAGGADGDEGDEDES